MKSKGIMTALAVAVAMVSIVAVLQTGGGVDEVDATSTTDIETAFQDGGSYMLTSDVTLTGTQTITGDLILDFNGYRIYTDDTITVNGDLTLKDSGENGGISANIPTSTNTEMHCMLDNYGSMTVYGGNYIMTYQNDTPSNAASYVIRNHNSLVVNDMDIDTISNGILTTANQGAGKDATMQAVTTIHDITIVTGSSGYGLVISGDDQITGEDDNEDAILTVYNADIQACVALGTNASNGLYAGFTMNILGGNYSGEYGMYAPGYGVYNISGGHFDNTSACIQIAAGILNISGDVLMETDVESNTPGLVNGSIDSEGVLVIGKANQYYIGDIEVNITGGELRNNNPAGDAIVMYDSSMGHEVFTDNTIEVNLTGGNVEGDLKVVSQTTYSGETPVPQNSSKLSFTLNGGNLTGDVYMDDEMESDISFDSGTFEGESQGVSIPTPTGTVYFPDGTYSQYYNGFRMPDTYVEYRDGYTFLGFSLSSNATEADYQPGEYITSSGNVTVYEVWESDVSYFPPIWDDDDEYIPPIVPAQPQESGDDDDTVTIVACAAAAVVAALLAAFLIIDRKH